MFTVYIIYGGIVNKYVFYTSLCSLFLNFFNGVQAGQVEIQLLVDDNDLAKARHITQTQSLHQENSIAFPHVSFLSVNDEKEIVQKHFAQFVKKVDVALSIAHRNNLMKFYAQGVKGYNSQHTGEKYWCLEDADKSEKNAPNKDIKVAAAFLKDSLEELIQKKTEELVGSEKPHFIRQTPDQMISTVREQTERAQQSYVEYAKGFPHMSVAKGTNLSSTQFSAAEENPFSLQIKGYKIIYTYSSDRAKKLPQIYLSKNLGMNQFNLHSEFNCLRNYGYHGDYENIENLLQEIGGIDSPYIKQEIQQIQHVQQIHSTHQTQPTSLKRKADEMLKDQDPRSFLEARLEELKNQLKKAKTVLTEAGITKENTNAATKSEKSEE